MGTKIRVGFLKDNLKSLIELAEESLKDIWGGKEEDIWNSYLKA